MTYDSPKPWLERPPIPCANEACSALVIGSHNYYQMSPAVRVERGLKPHGAKGYCQACLHRLKRTGTLAYKPNRGNPRPPEPPTRCLGPDCERMVTSGRRGDPAKGLYRMEGRGLCGVCYRRARADGTLIDYEVKKRSRDEVVEEYLELRLAGVSRIREAAPRLGLTPKALERALGRARAAGDERLAS